MGRTGLIVRQGSRSGLEIWCGWSESNRHSFRNRILSPARLPVPPHPHISVGTALSSAATKNGPDIPAGVFCSQVELPASEIVGASIGGQMGKQQTTHPFRRSRGIDAGRRGLFKPHGIARMADIPATSPSIDGGGGGCRIRSGSSTPARR